MRSLPYQRFWLGCLGLGEYRICYSRVNHRSVFDAERGRLNNSFVGAEIRHEEKRVDFWHSRKTGEIDLLHELVEGLHPDLPHHLIDPLCSELIAARQRGSAQELIASLGLGLRAGFVVS